MPAALTCPVCVFLVWYSVHQIAVDLYAVFDQAFVYDEVYEGTFFGDNGKAGEAPDCGDDALGDAEQFEDQQHGHAKEVGDMAKAVFGDLEDGGVA